jgi:hypothetical protein
MLATIRNTGNPRRLPARHTGMDRTTAWRTLGSILIAAAGIIVAFAYLTRPSAASCSYANQVNGVLGQPGTCSTGPSVVVFVIAGILALAGVLVLVNARRPG